MDGQILHNFLKEIKCNRSRRGRKSTRDRTVIQSYPYNDFVYLEKRTPLAVEDDFDEVGLNVFPSTSASALRTVFLAENSMNYVQ